MATFICFLCLQFLFLISSFHSLLRHPTFPFSPIPFTSSASFAFTFFPVFFLHSLPAPLFCTCLHSISLLFVLCISVPLLSPSLHPLLAALMHLSPFQFLSSRPLRFSFFPFVFFHPLLQHPPFACCSIKFPPLHPWPQFVSVFLSFTSSASYFSTDLHSIFFCILSLNSCQPSSLSLLYPTSALITIQFPSAFLASICASSFL